MKHRFFCPDLTTDRVELSEEEAGHALRVLRLREGDAVVLVDGRGTVAEAELLAAKGRSVEALVRSRIVHPAHTDGPIHLAVSPTKQAERFEWFVEKATELGVDRITPLLTARTERPRLRHDRLLRTAIAAMKQSQRAWLPQVDEAVRLKDLLHEPLPVQRFFGWCDRVPPEASAVAQGERVPLTTAFSPGTDAMLLIGPEGDFTPEEAEALRNAGFTAVSLGAARLRTETAALAACAWMGLKEGR